MATILLVEDEPEVREMSKNLLEILGHIVSYAESGEQAIGMVHENVYQVVLTDIGLPGIDGWAVAEAVKRASPQTQVGLVSGWEVPPTPEQLQHRGVDFLLPKPFTLDDIEETLSQL